MIEEMVNRFIVINVTTWWIKNPLGTFLSNGTLGSIQTSFRNNFSKCHFLKCKRVWKFCTVCPVQRFTFSFSCSVFARKDGCGNVVFTCFKRFIRLSVSVGPTWLYFTINNLANLNFILATKVNRGWILACLLLSDNFFRCLIFKVYLGEMKNKNDWVCKNNICIFMANIYFQWKHLISTLSTTVLKKCSRRVYSEWICLNTGQHICLVGVWPSWHTDHWPIGVTRKAGLGSEC